MVLEENNVTKKNKITIQLSFNENTMRYKASVAPNRHMDLITFSRGYGHWSFYTDSIEFLSKVVVNVPGNFGDEFPMEYFIKLCQARYMVNTGCEVQEVELSKSAKKMLEKEYLQKSTLKKVR